VILNEVGLDPGLDHMSSMAIVADVKKKGGKVLSYNSVCGGLPAPEAADNPLGYKFSWSPKGVLLAGTRPAKYAIASRSTRVLHSTFLCATRFISLLPVFL
jgi:saccharopine dehydrogenase-like NADP-dependent oxidoreductase